MAYRGSFSFGSGLTPWVKNLLIANVAIFLVDEALLQGQLRNYMAFGRHTALLQPWTIVTYMFAHGDFLHLFGNMLVLFFFGPPLESRWGSREFLKYYLVGGFGGAVLQLILVPGSSMIGASAATFAIMLAFAIYWPDVSVYIWGILPVKVKYLVMAYAVLSITFLNSGGGIAHAAHLGGFAAGFIYLRFSSPGHGIGGLRKMMNKRRLKVVSRDDSPQTAAAPRPSARGRGTGEEEKLLDELDRVLEKISTQGMSSLSPQERKLLDEVSRRYRTD
jgi:membrane associated rhomboid family serine protease